MILECNTAVDWSGRPTNRISRYFHGQSTFLGGRWYRERGATRGGHDADEWDENRRRRETPRCCPVPSLGHPSASYPGLPPAMATAADLEMEERGGGISEGALASSLRSAPPSLWVIFEEERRSERGGEREREKEKEERAHHVEGARGCEHYWGCAPVIERWSVTSKQIGQTIGIDDRCISLFFFSFSVVFRRTLGSISTIFWTNSRVNAGIPVLCFSFQIIILFLRWIETSREPCVRH